MPHVLDASAVVAFAKNEPGCDVVKQILLSGGCCIHSVNWVEFFYKIYTQRGRDKAEFAIDMLRRLNVSVMDVPDEAFRRKVAALKLSYPAFSLGDCYAVALAEWVGGTVVTSDKRFSEASGVVRVRQIR